MSLSSTKRRKSLVVANVEKNKFTTKHNQTKRGTHDKSETHEYMDTVKKSDIPVWKNAHRKSDADKTLDAEPQEKASGEPYVHEFKEFAGVTIILRSIPNPKGFGNYDGHGKTGMQAIRRKSEYQHPQSNTQDKFEHGDKTDHTGASYPLFAAKPDISTNNSNGT